jgi:hypothetical protein
MQKNTNVYFYSPNFLFFVYCLRDKKAKMNGTTRAISWFTWFISDPLLLKIKKRNILTGFCSCLEVHLIKRIIWWADESILKWMNRRIHKYLHVWGGWKDGWFQTLICSSAAFGTFLLWDHFITQIHKMYLNWYCWAQGSVK